MQKITKLNIIKYLVFAVIALFFVTAFPKITSADQFVDPGMDAILTVEFVTEKGPVEGMRFKAYRIINMDDRGNYRIHTRFSEYGLKIPTSEQGYKEFGETMAEYIERDNIVPNGVAVTDSEGRGYFGSLPNGVYLVIGERNYLYNGVTFSTKPSMIELPQPTGNADDPWEYEVTMYPKHSYVLDSQEAPEISVSKVWKDEDDADKIRPASITVVLSRVLPNDPNAQSEVVEEVVLNKDNNWRYKWTQLDPDYLYNVTEKDVPEGYTVSITSEDHAYTITNTHTPPPPPETTTTPGEETSGPPETTVPNEPPKKLKQTGQLWWPVPILAVVGLICIVSGTIVKKKR